MNKERRRRIKDIKIELQDLYCRLTTTRDEEEDYHENIPENLQESTKAEESEEYIDKLNDALDSIGNAIDELEDFN